MTPKHDANSTAWLVQRAFLAISLMIGFYVFALAIAILLLWIPYAMWTYVGRLPVKLAAASVGAGLTILWALVPRPDRFVPPGPRLEESEHPRLFNLIRSVAAATHQTAPSDVYLLNEMNAWVTHRGGTMGMGSRRVMGVGLPLLQAVSVPEFRAILAHEFGHYSSGDVALGPWIYKTRSTIGRTIAGVHKSVVALPFIWYGNQFLKLTHAVSRRQEFIADHVAARVAGARVQARALRRVTAVAPLFQSYFRSEVVPVLRAGFLPPIAAGFEEFLKTDRIAHASREIAADAEIKGETNAFDTHPSLRDRLAALGCAQDSGEPDEVEERASALLGDPDKHARALLERLIGHDALVQMKPTEWDAAGETVFARQWRELAKSQSTWLSRFTADALPAGRADFVSLSSGLVGAHESNIDDNQRLEHVVFLLGVGIGVLLLEDGWRVRTRPGTPMVLERDSRTFDPMAAVAALSDGTMTTDEWRAQCAAIGIAGRPLGIAA